MNGTDTPVTSAPAGLRASPRAEIAQLLPAARLVVINRRSMPGVQSVGDCMPPLGCDSPPPSQRVCLRMSHALTPSTVLGQRGPAWEGRYRTPWFSHWGDESEKCMKGVHASLALLMSWYIELGKDVTLGVIDRLRYVMCAQKVLFMYNLSVLSRRCKSLWMLRKIVRNILQSIKSHHCMSWQIIQLEKDSLALSFFISILTLDHEYLILI